MENPILFTKNKADNKTCSFPLQWNCYSNDSKGNEEITFPAFAHKVREAHCP